MIHFEDLVAARILNQQLPRAREELLATLDLLAHGDQQASLLAVLVDRRVLTLDQARFVHEAVERDKRLGVRNVYARLLIKNGVAGPRVQQVLNQVGDQPVEALGQAAVSAGLLNGQQDQRVRYEARVFSDRERNRQVEVFLESRRGAPAVRAPAEGESFDSSISDVVKLPAEATQEMVRDSALGGNVPAAPVFEVPEFVDTSDPQAGKLIGKFRVVGRIGAGAMGIVYMAEDPDQRSRPVAVKVLNDDASGEAKGRFKREILANGFFSHPGVIDIYDAGQTEAGNDYLAMEFFDGEDLEQILDSEKRLDPRRAVILCRQVFATLHAAHEAGIIHRDVKPANILISRDGEEARLMDFGVAVIRDLGEFEHMVFKTVEGGATGTPQFMSPEQAAGDRMTFSSDLYSMALVLYLCLSGRLPFESETANGFMACHMLEDPLPLTKAHPSMRALPPELPHLLERLLDKNPANRPPSAQAVCAELDAILPKLQEPKSSGRLFGFLWKGRGG